MEPELKEATGGRAVFQTSPFLKIKLSVDGEPLTKRPYFVVFEGREPTTHDPGGKEFETDAEGFAEFDIPTRKEWVTGYWAAVEKTAPVLEGTIHVQDDHGSELALRFKAIDRDLPRGQAGDSYRAVHLGLGEAPGAVLWSEIRFGNILEEPDILGWRLGPRSLNRCDPEIPPPLDREDFALPEGLDKKYGR